MERFVNTVAHLIRLHRVIEPIECKIINVFVPREKKRKEANKKIRTQSDCSPEMVPFVQFVQNIVVRLCSKAILHLETEVSLVTEMIIIEIKCCCN